ncbi:MAG: inositol 2-dehydrogenase [Shimia sp.]
MTTLAILGAGRIGQVHADAIAATTGARLVAVADAMEGSARAVADKHGARVDTIDGIEGDGTIDGVLICTPTDTHADLIERFARAGKAIFCEKPIDLDAARVRACLEVVSETQATLMVGFNRRYDPDFAALRIALPEAVGEVELVQITSRDPAPPPVDYIHRSGGLFRDMTIHDFDMARWLLGEEPSTVLATGACLTDPAIGEAGDIDTASIILRTPSGRQAVITNSRRATYGYDQRIEVHGSLGMVAASNHHTARIQVAGQGGFTQPPLEDFFMTRYAAAYRAEIAAFVTALANGTPPPTGGDDGLKALLLADAAEASMKTGKAVAV